MLRTLSWTEGISRDRKRYLTVTLDDDWNAGFGDPYAVDLFDLLVFVKLWSLMCRRRIRNQSSMPFTH